MEKNIFSEEKLTVDLKGLMNLLSVGRQSAEKLGSEANAVIRVGRRKLYSVDKVRQYLIEKTGA